MWHIRVLIVAKAAAHNYNRLHLLVFISAISAYGSRGSSHLGARGGNLPFKEEVGEKEVSRVLINSQWGNVIGFLITTRKVD